MTDLDAALCNLQDHLAHLDDSDHAKLTALIASLHWACTVAEQRLCVMEAAFVPPRSQELWLKEIVHVD